MALWTKLKPEWEAGVREKLERDRQWLFGPEGERLLSALREKFPGLAKAYLVSRVPDQSEDLYTVVVGPDLIAFVELDRYEVEAEPVITTQSAREYRKRHPKPGREMREGLEVAVQLMRE